MLGHGCGVSQYPQFYDTILFQTLPRSYVGRYLSEKGRQFWHKPWILALAKSVGIFILVSISDMPTIKYWQNWGGTMDKVNEKIPKECRIGDTCFT